MDKKPTRAQLLIQNKQLKDACKLVEQTLQRLVAAENVRVGPLVSLSFETIAEADGFKAKAKQLGIKTTDAEYNPISDTYWVDILGVV